MIKIFTLAALGMCASAQTSEQLHTLVETYKYLHMNPELSHHEAQTAAFVAKELSTLGFTVTEGIGKYPDAQAYGLVGVLKNGAGPVVLVRTELDALPVEERTGLPYASHSRGVMHACGHDLHMTSFLGTARMLVEKKAQWRGTLMFVGQPSEETIDGSRAMLADGFYERFGKPDFAIALHDSANLEAGKVAIGSGYVMASATAVEVTIRGLGGHGAWPENTKDPVVTAAQVVLALQTIVSRQISPLDPAVVTVGSIHGGSKNNIIPDEVKLQLSVRAYREEVRLKILAAIERTARGIALAAGIPEDRAPIVKSSETEVTPALYNDPALTARVETALKKTLGAGNVVEAKPVMGSEDFGRFGLEGRQIPVCMFNLGAVEPAKVAESLKTGVPLPSLHSSLFAPVPEPSIRTGVAAMTAAVLELLADSRKTDSLPAPKPAVFLFPLAPPAAAFALLGKP